MCVERNLRTNRGRRMRSLRLPDKHKYKQRIRRRRLEVCLGKLIENVRGWKVGGVWRLGLQTKVIKSAALKLLSNAKVYLRQRIALLFLFLRNRCVSFSLTQFIPQAAHAPFNTCPPASVVPAFGKLKFSN